MADQVWATDTDSFQDLARGAESASIWERHPNFPLLGSVGHLAGLTEEALAALRSGAMHVCWGVFPHESAEAPLTRLTLVDAKGRPDAEAVVDFVNPSPGRRHLRTVWNCALPLAGDDEAASIPERLDLVTKENFGGPVSETILHLDESVLQSLPRYRREHDDSQYPAEGSI